MGRLSILLLIALITISCKKEKLTANKIDFETSYLFDSEIAQKVAVDSLGQMLQMYATEYSLKSDFLKAQRVFDSIYTPRIATLSEMQMDSIRSLYSHISASEYILEQSKKHKLTIINEAHHVPYHRTFTTSLLKELYANGYRHLGLEALNPLDTLLTDRGYPIKKTGFYIKEPEFGNMIRTALKIGYNVFGYEDYESFKKGGAQREIGQAENVRKLMEAHPNDKVLIHCGYAHASEGSNDIWEKAMARRVAEMTGVDPFTIDQTKYVERSSPSINNPILQAIDFEKSTVLMDKNNAPISYASNDDIMDIAVFHPLTKLKNGRPSWKFQNREKVALAISDLEISYPVMVFAYPIDENVNEATPVDIVELNTKSDAIMALTKGVFQIIVTNGKESLRFEQIVE